MYDETRSMIIVEGREFTVAEMHDLNGDSLDMFALITDEPMAYERGNGTTGLLVRSEIIDWEYGLDLDSQEERAEEYLRDNNYLKDMPAFMALADTIAAQGWSYMFVETADGIAIQCSRVAGTKLL